MIVPVYQALLRPNLLMGGDRTLVLLNVFISAAGIMTCLDNMILLVIIALFAMLLHIIIIKASRIDPDIRLVLVRYLSYQDFYPAKALRHAQAPTIQNSTGS